MNWKNITLETDFLKQEVNLNGSKATNYIPLNQVDSFGVTNSENKKWLYAAIFMLICMMFFATTKSIQPSVFCGIVACGLGFVYVLTRKMWFTIASSQSRFSVLLPTNKEEIQAVNIFIDHIKTALKKSSEDNNHKSIAA